MCIRKIISMREVIIVMKVTTKMIRNMGKGYLLGHQVITIRGNLLMILDMDMEKCT